MAEKSTSTVITLAAVFTALSILVVALRLQARLLKTKTLTTDDYLILGSVVFFVLTITVPTLILAINSNLGNHMVPGPDGMPMPPTYAFNLTLRILQTTHVIPITLAKLSLLFFYRRIFRGPSFNTASWAMIVASTAWGIAFFLSILFQCTPIDLSLILPPTAPKLTCINQMANFWALSISDVLIDVIILCMPFPFVWKLQMSNSAKLGVSAMFLLGILTIGASIARLVIFLNAGRLLAENDPDSTYYVAPTAYIVAVEASLAITSACLPVLKPLFSSFSLETILRSLRNMFSLRSTAGGTRTTDIQHPGGRYSELAVLKNEGSGLASRAQRDTKGARSQVRGIVVEREIRVEESRL